MRIPSPAANRLLLSGATLAAALVALPARPAEKAGKPTSAATVILLLDGYVQTRFEQDDGKFGLMRIPPPVDGHDTIGYQLYPQNDGEKDILRTVGDSGLEYLVEFIHCTHVPGHRQEPGTPRPDPPRVTTITLVAAKSTAAPFRPYTFSKEREEFMKTTELPIIKKASAAMDRLAKGAAVDTKLDTWKVAFRPVRASKASCLNCHVGAKAGDTLGIMAYAVRPPIKPAPTGPSPEHTSQ